MRFDPIHSPPGTPEEEATRGQASYLEILAGVHEALAPSMYLEIGVRHGRSLSLARCPAIGVDPAPDISGPLKPTTQVLAMTSDDYFAVTNASLLPQPPDLVFIDGLHWFEYALRDFMQVERRSAPHTLVVIDDIYPCHPAQAERDRRTRVWTGDIWKLHRCLARLRPDLFLLSLDTSPTGMLLVAGVDSSNRVLWDRYERIAGRYGRAMRVPADVLSRRGAAAPTRRTVAGLLAWLREGRGAARSEIVSGLCALRNGDGVES